MREITLRKFHRITGIALSIFIVLQVLTGMFLSVELLVGSVPFENTLDFLHFGDGIVGNGYRLLLGLGLLFMVVTGWWIFMKISARSATAAKTAGSEPGARTGARDSRNEPVSR